MTTVHQILFGWAERDSEGNAGVRPVAHSGPPTIDRWAGRLQYVWATQDDAPADADTTAATASLVHLVFEDEAAVLRKLPSRNVHGRGGATLTHALVGAPHAIDAQLALGLHDWPGWRESEPAGGSAVLDPLDLEDLRDAARPGLAALRERVADIPDGQLTALVARMLGEPSADFTVITRPGQALPMMTALLDIAGPVPGRPWTFASRESTDVGSHQPRVVFLSAPPPQSYYVNKRLRVEPATAAPDPDGPRFAGRLVELYLSSGHAALERIRPQSGLATADDAAAWGRSVPIVDGRIADPRLDLDVLVDDDLLAARGHLTFVRARLVGELRHQPVDWLTTVVERWQHNEWRAGRHPELRDIVVSEAVHTCLGLYDSAADPLVNATADAEPPPPTVASVFARQVPPDGLDLTQVKHLRLLVVALHLGLEASALDRKWILAATPAPALLNFVAEYGAEFPDAAYIALRRHLSAAAYDPYNRGTREGVVGVWYQHGLLLSQVERIANGDRAKEHECYRLLLTAAYGSQLSGADAAALMERAGDRAPSGLLAAALERAEDEAAERPIRREASDRYFREEGYQLALRAATRPTPPPPPAEPYAAAPQRPPAPEQVPGWAAPRTTEPHTSGHVPEPPTDHRPWWDWFGQRDGLSTAVVAVFIVAILVIVGAVTYIVMTPRP